MKKQISQARVHLGSGPLTKRREASVFINCPFDSEFIPFFDAIVFSTLCCGFLPRCAIESGNSSVPRMERILDAMFASKYSIHDFSRCKGEGDANLARFNMPLELGMSMAQRFVATEHRDAHDWLLLVPSGHLYNRFVSDLAGYDPVTYDGKLETIIPSVMAWLATRPDAVKTPTPVAVINTLPVFQEARQDLCSSWGNQVPWADILLAGMRVAKKSGLFNWNQKQILQ